VLLSSGRPQLPDEGPDEGGAARGGSRGSSATRVFGRQAAPDDDSPERCCDGRSLSVRVLCQIDIMYEHRISEVFNLTD
jgi:hypothetical protein